MSQNDSGLLHFHRAIERASSGSMRGGRRQGALINTHEVLRELRRSRRARSGRRLYHLLSFGVVVESLVRRRGWRRDRRQRWSDSERHKRHGQILRILLVCTPENIRMHLLTSFKGERVLPELADFSLDALFHLEHFGVFRVQASTNFSGVANFLEELFARSPVYPLIINDNNNNSNKRNAAYSTLQLSIFF